MAKILVVDDDEILCHVLTALFRRSGHDASSAVGGEAALKSLDASLPDLVLLDLMMPGLNGIEVLKEIRAHEKSTDLPVVMYTASVDPDYEELARKERVNAYWWKGVAGFEELQRRVEQLLKTPADA